MTLGIAKIGDGVLCTGVLCVNVKGFGCYRIRAPHPCIACLFGHGRVCPRLGPVGEVDRFYQIAVRIVKRLIGGKLKVCIKREILTARGVDHSHAPCARLILIPTKEIVPRASKPLKGNIRILNGIRGSVAVQQPLGAEVGDGIGLRRKGGAKRHVLRSACGNFGHALTVRIIPPKEGVVRHSDIREGKRAADHGEALGQSRKVCAARIKIGNGKACGHPSCLKREVSGGAARNRGNSSFAVEPTKEGVMGACERLQRNGSRVHRVGGGVTVQNTLGARVGNGIFNGVPNGIEGHTAKKRVWSKHAARGIGKERAAAVRPAAKEILLGRGGCGQGAFCTVLDRNARKPRFSGKGDHKAKGAPCGNQRAVALHGIGGKIHGHAVDIPAVKAVARAGKLLVFKPCARTQIYGHVLRAVAGLIGNLIFILTLDLQGIRGGYATAARGDLQIINVAATRKRQCGFGNGLRACGITCDAPGSVGADRKGAAQVKRGRFKPNLHAKGSVVSIEADCTKHLGALQLCV